jgi:Bacterial Ig-like domain (group 3)/MBG domain (YGX type)/FG-GAP-like repeat
MKLFCSCGLRCLMWMVLLLVAVVPTGTMMRAQTATTTTLTVSPSSSPGSPLPPQTVVTLTATVTAGGTAVSPGLVTFCDATATNCTGLAVLGTAQLTSAETAVLRLIPGSGIRTYHAVFAGTTAYATSTSTPQSVTVEAPSSFPTTTSITFSGSAGNYALTATVVGIGNTAAGPTGNVDFIDTTNLNRLLGTAALGAPTLGQSFANATGSPVAVGINPNNAAVGDFNGDGIPDLAVPNPASNYISILLGDGKGGFAPELPVAADGTPLGVAVGDFNGDGIPDLAVANFDPDTVSILLGNGNGTFREAAGAPIAIGTNPDFVAVGDFNSDGIADIAVTNSGTTTVSILLGDGSGGFTEVQPRVEVGSVPRDVAVGDFNGDGIADLEVANQGSNTVSILLGKGDGSFGTSQVAVGTSPFGVAMGDFNRDGFADLAVTNLQDNTVSILLGDGHGTFTQATGSPIAVGNVPRNVSVGDFNGDGIADLAVTDSNDNNVRILLGNGLGSFTQAQWSPIAVGGRPYGVSVGDFNGDGITDLAVVNLVSDTVSILLNQVTQTATATLTGVSVPGSATHEIYATYPETESTIFNGSASPAIPLTGSPVATTTTLLLSTADTIAFGTPVTLTAYVAPHTVDHLTATGTVEFFDGTTSLGTATISATGVASITAPPFAVAVRSLTAVYHPGDTNFLTSTSPIVSLTVNQAQIAVSLISSQNPSVYGQIVMFTATVPSGATGTIQFRNGALNLGAPVTIAAGAAAIATTTLTPGTHSIIAMYSGDASHLAAPSDVLAQLVTPAILTVTANSSTRTFNQPNAPLDYTITGFVGSDTEVSAVTGAPALLTTATEASPVGSYPVVVGLGSLVSSNYSFVFVNGSLTVTRATPGVGGIAAITLTSSINPSSWGESVTFTATVPPHATGQVTFVDGAVALSTATVLNEAASLSTSQLAVGTHRITAMYGGDTNYSGASSAALSQIVNTATLYVIAKDAQRVFGQPNPPFETTITGFIEGDSSVIRGVPVVTTTATPTSPAAVYPIVPTQGTLTATNYSFVFIVGKLTIVPATPGIGPTAPVTIASSLNPAPFGRPVILTVTVPSGATGTVTFADGTTVLGTATITGNTSSLTTAALAVGTHLITATYSGDTNFTASSSVVLSLVVVTAADFMVVSSTGRQLVPPGASANFTIVVRSMNEPFTNPVTMSATNLPPGATYSFSSAAVTPGAAGASTTFTVSVPPQSNVASRSGRLGPVAFGLLLLPLACLKRYRRTQKRLLLWILVGLASLDAVSGCGEGGYFSQTEQTYTITVTGTSGNLVRSTTVTLTVE